MNKSSFNNENSPLAKVGSQVLMDHSLLSDNKTANIKKLRGSIQASNSKISAPTSRQDNLSKASATKI
jgi:hypothetical protein